jgi:hypothetical protein
VGTSLAVKLRQRVPRLWKCIVLVIFLTFCPRLSEAASLTVAWDPPIDGVTVGYVLSYGTASGSYSQNLNVGNATSCTLNGLLDGVIYYFVVRAYDAAGNLSAPSAEISAALAPSVSPAVTALTLTANVPPPLSVGTPVSWLATATGGVAPYQFQWALYTVGQWTVWPWTDASTWTWTPSTSGNDFEVKVAVRSACSTDSRGEMSQSVPFTVVSRISLSASVLRAKGVRSANLVWNGATGTNVDIYRNNARIATTLNDGAYADTVHTRGHTSYTYKVCATGTSTCSNNSTVGF